MVSYGATTFQWRQHLLFIRKKLRILIYAEHLFLTQPFSVLERLGECSVQSDYQEKICYKRLIPGIDHVQESI